MKKWDILADKKTVEKTIAALLANGIEVEFVENGANAKKRVLDLIPRGAEVMTMTSMTVDSIGLDRGINDSGRYDSIRNKLMSMDLATQGLEMQKLGVAPDFAVGSVHSVTHEGQVLIASNSGSQLPAYAYGASQVIWVVGAQKIVKNIDEGIKRIYEYCLPLEDARARKAYGVGSGVSKILIINREKNPGRMKMILVGEKLGF